MQQQLMPLEPGRRKGFLSAKVRHLIDTKFDYTNNQLIKTYDDWKVLADRVPNLLTNAGKDYFHAQDYTNNGAGGVGANFIALTESVITPAVTDTTLTGEIATNGLQRVIATTRTHTAATSISTLSQTFTASGTFTSVLCSALFNASSVGVMAHSANFASGSGALISGDQLIVTWTMTLS
jgi:hypothetical protein